MERILDLQKEFKLRLERDYPGALSELYASSYSGRRKRYGLHLEICVPERMKGFGINKRDLERLTYFATTFYGDVKRTVKQREKTTISGRVGMFEVVRVEFKN